MNRAEFTNADRAELNHFGALAARWWDPTGPSKPLIAINPVRLAFIQSFLPLKAKAVVDIGCGGGLLSEAMAALDARVLGVDLSAELIEIAKLHALESGIGSQLDYQLQSAESLAVQCAGQFDVVTCMEMLEHVPDPAAIIQAASKLLKPGGWLFASTLNRTAKAFALGIVAAEYLLGLVPKGTHRFAQFITPAELALVCRQQGFAIQSIRGLQYSPLSNSAALSDHYDINYLVAARKL
jgi:2-polyprenyl-6-hydroxyphenyl methylase / 3-demethylubiquinone-9 3-methyltransferase